MKKFTTFLLIATLSISLCACGSKKQLEAYESTVTTLESQVAQYENDMSALKEENGEYEKSLAQADKENAELAKQLEELQSQLDASQLQLNEVQSENERLTAENERLDAIVNPKVKEVVLEGQMYTVPEGYSFVTKDNVTYKAGEQIYGSQIQYGDRLIGKDYIYQYTNCMESDYKELAKGWKVAVVDKNRSSYPDIEGQMDIPVVSLMSTFSACRKLTQAPAIPDTVRTMRSTFWGCENLTKFGDFPPNVVNLESTFGDCVKLTEVGDIPEGVTRLGETFSGCTSLKSAPVAISFETDSTTARYAP